MLCIVAIVAVHYTHSNICYVLLLLLLYTTHIATHAMYCCYCCCIHVHYVVQITSYLVVIVDCICVRSAVTSQGLGNMAQETRRYFGRGSAMASYGHGKELTGVRTPQTKQLN